MNRLEQGLRELAIGEVEPAKSEIWELTQDREPGLPQRRIVIGIDIVNADDGVAVLEQPAREAKADKSRGAGDQNRKTVCSLSVHMWLVHALDERGCVASDRPTPILTHRGRAMQENSKIFVGLDTSKMKISVALAEEGRQGEVRFLGDIYNTPDAIRRLVRKLTGKFGELLFCYEAGPTGYGLHRQITALGHACSVIAPSLIPKRPGEHVKTNRRDALTLARLHRAGELTTIWVPDPGHEAIRDLVRAREAAMEDLREKRQQLQSFLLRHGRIYPGLRSWTLVHARWLSNLTFEHPAQYLVLREYRQAIEDAEARLERLTQQVAELSRLGQWRRWSRPIRPCAV